MERNNISGLGWEPKFPEQSAQAEKHFSLENIDRLDVSLIKPEDLDHIVARIASNPWVAESELERFYEFLRPLGEPLFSYYIACAYAIRAHDSKSAGKLFKRAVSIFRKVLSINGFVAIDGMAAKIHNAMGNALAGLGTSESGDAKIRYLQDAVASYILSIMASERDQKPLLRAKAQNNMGQCLLTLGERVGGVEGAAIMSGAVAAHTEALEIYSIRGAYSENAYTRELLASALMALGAGQDNQEGEKNLRDAVTLFAGVLQEATHNVRSIKWAVMKMNMGVALARLGEKLAGEEALARLREAEANLLEAIAQCQAGAAPVLWAQARVNLANCLSCLGERLGEEGAPRLLEAVALYENVLGECDKTAVPLQRSMVKINQSAAYLRMARIGYKENESVALAIAGYCEAIKALGDGPSAMRDAAISGRLSAVKFLLDSDHK